MPQLHCLHVACTVVKDYCCNKRTPLFVEFVAACVLHMPACLHSACCTLASIPTEYAGHGICAALRLIAVPQLVGL